MRSKSPQSAHFPQDSMKRREEDCTGRRRLLRTRILTLAAREEARRKQQDGGAYFPEDASQAGVGFIRIPRAKVLIPARVENKISRIIHLPALSAKLATCHPQKGQRLYSAVHS